MKKLSLCVLVVLSTALVILTYRVLARPVENARHIAWYGERTRQLNIKDDSKTLSQMLAKQPGIYYYGFPECPWCQELTPIVTRLLKAHKAQAETVNVHGDTYDSVDREQLKRFYQATVKQENVSVPFLVFINSKGEIKTHVGTVEGHNATKAKLTMQQKEQLRSELAALIAWSQP